MIIFFIWYTLLIAYCVKISNNWVLTFVKMKYQNNVIWWSTTKLLICSAVSTSVKPFWVHTSTVDLAPTVVYRTINQRKMTLRGRWSDTGYPNKNTWNQMNTKKCNYFCFSFHVFLIKNSFSLKKRLFPLE